MRAILFFIILCCFCSLPEAYAQKGTLRYGYSSTGMGLGKMTPQLKKEVQGNAWTSFHYRMRILEFQVGWGDFSFQGANNPDVIEGDGVLLNLGVNIPLHKFTLKQRKDYLRGLHITPLVGVHYATHGMNLDNGINAQQAGINIAPALSVQIPYAIIDLRLNNTFYFGGKRNEQMQKYRGGGYMFSPAISIQLDGFFEVLGATISKAGSYSYNFQVLADEEVEYKDYGTYRTKTTTKTYETYNSSGISYVAIQNAFWYVSGKINRGMPIINYDNAISTYSAGLGLGFGVGGRYKGFMADISFEKNNGFYAIRDPEHIEALTPHAADYPLVEGRFNANEIRGKAGFDILTAITNIIAPRRNRTLKNRPGNWVKFSRFHGGVSGGFGLPGKVEILSAEGEAALDDFFTSHPELSRDKQTDITLSSGFTWNIGLFLNLEMGPISLEYDWHGHHNYGWRSSVGLSYMLPLQELLKNRR